MLPRSLIRISLGLVPALGVLAVGLAAAAGAGTTRSPQQVHVTLTARGPVLGGPTSWRPGAVRIDAASRLDDQEVTLLRFRPGYTYARFLADGRASHGRGAAARAALADVFAHTIFEGGLDLFRGQSAGFTVDVEPGTYYLGEMTRRPQFTRIRVSGPPLHAAVRSAATIAATDHGFRLSGALPAAGTVDFANETSRPQRLNFMRVAPETTRAQVLAYLRKSGDSDKAPPPPFAVAGPQLGTADLSPHRRMQLTYRLPAGTYAAVDLDRDMQTGRPEALEGLVAVVRIG